MRKETALSANSRELIKSELERLFAFQDKNISDRRQEILAAEIERLGLPMGAILAGMKSLSTDDVPALKFSVIVAAIRKHMEPEKGESACSNCSGGFVLMKCPQAMVFSLACTCPRGQQIAVSHRLVRWNGQGRQESKGRELVKY